MFPFFFFTYIRTFPVRAKQIGDYIVYAAKSVRTQAIVWRRFLVYGAQ